MAYNIKNIRQEFKDKGIFYTDSKLAEIMKSYVDRPISEVYDPTCGDGALLSVFAPEVKKYGQELNADQLEVAASRLENFEGACGDTLQAPAFEDKQFECIMANPPFSIKWEHPRRGGRFQGMFRHLVTLEKPLKQPRRPVNRRRQKNGLRLRSIVEGSAAQSIIRRIS